MGYVIDLQNNDMEFSYFLFYAKEYRFDLFQHWYFLMNERDHESEIYDTFKNYKTLLQKLFENQNLVSEAIKLHEDGYQKHVAEEWEYKGQFGKDHFRHQFHRHRLFNLEKCFDVYREYYSLSAKKRLEFKLDILGKELYLFGVSKEFQSIYKKYNGVLHTYNLIRKNYFSLKNSQFPANMCSWCYDHNNGTIHSHKYNTTMLEEKNIEQKLNEICEKDKKSRNVMFCTLRPSENVINLLDFFHNPKKA